MQIRINGRIEEVNAKTLDELIKLKGFDCQRVVIEHNLNIIDKLELKKVHLKPNDTIEILSFIGGG
jgi:sulfur carrier protein